MTDSPWTTILTRNELDSYYNLAAALDPNFARAQRNFYETKSLHQLKVLMVQSWDSNEATSFLLARSHAALLGDQSCPFL